jgi:hypothetical protein
MAAETASETPLWRKLVPNIERNVLYLLDLGFFERQLFIDAVSAGAHVLMRLKSNAKVRVVGHTNSDGTVEQLNESSLAYHIKYLNRRKGTTFDLDVVWGKGAGASSRGTRPVPAGPKFEPRSARACPCFHWGGKILAPRG